MRVHRFYIDPSTELKHDFWLHDERLIHQWRTVLRMSPGQDVVLFDGLQTDRLYKITELNEREAHLLMVTDYARKMPKREVYLLFALLKKDKNDWVIQKGTELGISHFVPLLAERSEKTGFNVERSLKIAIEAAEQCGRSDIPNVREPMRVETALNELHDMTVYIGEQGTETPESIVVDRLGILIGPEGGWSDTERELFQTRDLPHIALGDFTLRSETAAVVAAASLLQK